MYPHYAKQCLCDIFVFTMYQQISSTKTIAAFHIIQVRWYPSVCHTHSSKLLFANRSIMYQRYCYLLLLHLTLSFDSALQQPNRLLCLFYIFPLYTVCKLHFTTLHRVFAYTIGECSRLCTSYLHVPFRLFTTRKQSNCCLAPCR